MYRVDANYCTHEPYAFQATTEMSFANNALLSSAASSEKATLSRVRMHQVLDATLGAFFVVHTT